MRRALEFYSCSDVRGVCRMNLFRSVDADGLVGQTAPSVFTIPLRCHAFAAPPSVHVVKCVLGVSSMRVAHSSSSASRHAHRYHIRRAGHFCFGDNVELNSQDQAHYP